MQWKQNLTKLMLVIGLAGLLSACGFQLRGLQDVDESLRQVELVQGPASTELMKSLRDNMKFNGIKEVSGAPYQIRILEHNYKRKSATVSNTDIDEYELSLQVIMHVADKTGKALTPDIRVQRERLYDYDKNAATASGEQEKQLRIELYDAVAQSIIRRYLAIKTQ
jgi:LPS-assembly lipoprotein